MIAKVGSKIILNRLNSTACNNLLYFLPYRKTPIINIATAEVVPPNIFSVVSRGEGIFIPMIDIIKPHKIDKINGFVKSLFIMILKIEMIFFLDSEIEFEFSSLYNSRTVMVIIFTAIEVEDTVKIARYSACFIGNANVINGMPKKAVLLKTDIIVKRYKVFFVNLNI